MRPTVDYKLKIDSRWLTGSAVMIGFAFFIQAFDYIGLRQLQDIGLLELIAYMILPMLAEAVWCVYIRSNQEQSAKIGGIIGAVLCLIVFVQTLFCGNLFLLLVGCASCLLAAAVIVLISWGFIAHRHLGLLVFAAVAAIRILLFGVIAYISDWHLDGILREMPMVCILLALMLYFGGIYPMRKE